MRKMEFSPPNALLMMASQHRYSLVDAFLPFAMSFPHRQPPQQQLQHQHQHSKEVSTASMLNPIHGTLPGRRPKNLFPDRRKRTFCDSTMWLDEHLPRKKVKAFLYPGTVLSRSSSNASLTSPGSIHDSPEEVSSPASDAAKGTSSKKKNSGGNRRYMAWCDEERHKVMMAALDLILQRDNSKYRGGRRQDLVVISKALESKTSTQCRDFYYRCLKQIGKMLEGREMYTDLSSDCDFTRAALILYLKHYRIANDGSETRHLNFAARSQASKYLKSSLLQDLIRFRACTHGDRIKMVREACQQ